MTDEDAIRSQTAAVPGLLAGQRLDQALAQMFPEYSRSRLKTWILQGHALVDGAMLRPRDIVRGGETVQLRPQPEIAVSSEAEAIRLDVAYEDEALLVIDKPAGLVVHPGAGNMRGTLLNGLLHRLPELGELPRAGIVHRLDKDTSGLLLVARTLQSHTALTRLLADHAIARHYLAICNGVLTGGGRIDAPLARHPVDRLRMSVQERGRRAVTHYKVLQRYAAHTCIAVQLETGRTHQIRVHFAWRRHPLLGDPVYGGRLAMPAGAGDELQALLRGFRRQALHAARLEFPHPQDGRRIEVEAAAPPDFAALREALARHARETAG